MEKSSEESEQVSASVQEVDSNINELLKKTIEESNNANKYKERVILKPSSKIWAYLLLKALILKTNSVENIEDCVNCAIFNEMNRLYHF